MKNNIVLFELDWCDSTKALNKLSRINKKDPDKAKNLLINDVKEVLKLSNDDNIKITVCVEPERLPKLPLIYIEGDINKIAKHIGLYYEERDEDDIIIDDIYDTYKCERVI